MTERIIVDIRDHYWIVNNTNPTTQVYSSATGGMVADNAAAYLTWLTDGSKDSHASAYGHVMPITAAADNGSGKTRLTVLSSASVQTGQVFNVEDNGNQEITVNVSPANTIDLLGLDFSAYVAATALWGPTIVPTAAALAATINNAAIESSRPAFLTIGDQDFTLTNPLPFLIQASPSAAIRTLTLPEFNAPDSLPNGEIVWLLNKSATKNLDIDRASGSLLTSMPPFEIFALSAFDGSPGGAFNVAVMGQLQPIDALLKMSAVRPAFSAHKNGTAQTGITSATETKITFGTEAFDVGSYYDTTNSRWTPPAGPIFMNALAAFAAVNIVDQASYYAVIRKNGANYKFGAILSASGTNGPGVLVTAFDIANGTDYYEVFALGGGAGNKEVQGGAALTYFQGAVL